MNYYSVYFCSKNSGPRTIEIEARSDTDARAQINARFPGVTNMSTSQLQQSSYQKAADEARRRDESNARQARDEQHRRDLANKQRQMEQDSRDRQARQEANNRADQARRDQERQNEQNRRDHETSERQHREQISTIERNKPNSVLPFVAGAAVGYLAAGRNQSDVVVTDDDPFIDDPKRGRIRQSQYNAIQARYAERDRREAEAVEESFEPHDESYNTPSRDGCIGTYEGTGDPHDTFLGQGQFGYITATSLVNTYGDKLYFIQRTGSRDIIISLGSKRIRCQLHFSLNIENLYVSRKELESSWRSYIAEATAASEASEAAKRAEAERAEKLKAESKAEAVIREAKKAEAAICEAKEIEAICEAKEAEAFAAQREEQIEAQTKFYDAWNKVLNFFLLLGAALIASGVLGYLGWFFFGRAQ